MTLKFVINPMGMLPALKPRVLPDNYSQDCANCDLKDGTISSIPGPEQITNLGTTDWRSFFKYLTDALYWTDADIKVIRGQVPEGNERIFYTGDGYPKQTDKTLMSGSGTPSDTTEYRRLGVVAPTPTLTINIGGTGTGVVEDSVSYYYTYVVKWADGTEQESAPSPATAVADIEEDEYVYLTGFSIPALATNGNDITHVRVYRLTSGSASAEYQQVKVRKNNVGASEAWDISVSGLTSVYDNNAAATGLTTSLGDVSQVEDWDDPPADMHQITQYMNGVLVGISGRNVCFSVPLIYYAWPAEYQYPIDYDGVAVGIYGQAAIILTGSKPYRMTGDPSSIFSQLLDYEQPCLSARGVVSTNIGVIYPSPDGLFLINNTGGYIITAEYNGAEAVLTKEAWNDLPPDGYDHGDLVGFFYDNAYIGFWAGSDRGFIFDLSRRYLVLIDLVDTVYHGCKDPDTDALYLLTKINTTYYAKKWRTGSDLSWYWYSKDFESEPINYAYCMVLGDQSVSSSISFKAYGNGTQLDNGGTPFEKVVTDQSIFRLPAQKQFRSYKFLLVGSCSCRGFIVATSRQEIEEVIKKL